MLSKISRRSYARIVERVLFNGSRAVSHIAFCGKPARCFSTEANIAAESHEFKAETRKLLDIVARSLYTDKEVFIRELISNASDALEKFRFLSSTHQIKSIVAPETELRIQVEVDEGKRTFTISDSGIGMSRSELIDNLGTIARSGSKKFLEEVGSSDNKIIGQFGVGFYSAFVVADKVRVYSRAADGEKDENGYVWESDGTGTFTVSKDDSVSRGTRIEIHLKEEAADFAKFELVRSAATKFSSFIDFPIKVVSGDQEADISQQEALWLKTSASEDQHTDFFRFLTGNSYGEPKYAFFFHADAPMSIKSVFYIPEDSPEKFFSAASVPKSGVALHSRRVLVAKHADTVIPQWLYWVKGVLDCEDMPLNISRESMQDTALLKKLSNVVVKRILRFLIDESKKNSDKYNAFYKNFATFLKAGLLEDVRLHNGALHKDQLLKLLRFELVNAPDSTRLVSLEEYVDLAGSEQQNILYVNASSRKVAEQSPYLDGVKGPVLLLTDDIDDFVVNSIGAFKEKKFVSIDSGDETIARETESADESSTKLEDSDKEKLLELFKKSLESKKVNDVSFSSTLRSSPAIVTSQLSPHMRKMMKNIMAQTGQTPPEEDLLDAMPVKLELSESDPLIRALTNVSDETTAQLIATQIYLNAMIAAGMVEDARSVLPSVTELLRVCINQAVSSKIM